MEEHRNSFLLHETTDINEPSVLPYLKEINESPETRARCLEMLRQELKNIKDIDPFLDDIYLLPFLRVSKFNTQNALQRILNYFRECDALLEAFSKLSIPLQKAQSTNHFFISPYRMKNNSFLAIGQNKPVDYRKYTFAERMYLEVLVANELLFEFPLNQICGVTCLFDFDGFNRHTVFAYTPGWLRTWVNFALNAAPLRVKAVHIINAPAIISTLYNMLKPLLPQKIRERIFMHSRNNGWQDLHDFIPVDVLPKQYGGNLSDEKLINCLQNVEELEQKFLKTFAFGSIKNQHKRKSMKIIC